MVILAIFFSVTMTTIIRTPQPLDSVENEQKDKGKHVRCWEAAMNTDQQPPLAGPL